MKKYVRLAIAAILLAFSSLSAQSVPVSIKIESTRVIGDKLLLSGKMQASEDVGLASMIISAITPDGEIYESDGMWWGGNPLSPMSFGNNLISDINYAFDIAFEVKSKTVTGITSLTFDIFNRTTQQRFKVSLKDIKAPFPANPILDNPSVTEISKDVYLKWTKIEETKTGFKINFVVENKSNKDQTMNFRSYNNAKIVDNEGNSYEAKITLKDSMTFPIDSPVAGNITVDKPLKANQIALIEFSSNYFNYRIKKIVVKK